MKYTPQTNTLALKVFIYILGIFRAALYTPIILSFAFFIIVLISSFQQNNLNLPLYFIPDGTYETADILGIYGRYAFGFSLVISITELIFRKRIAVSAKTKTILLTMTLLLGYLFSFIFFIVTTPLDFMSLLIVLGPFISISILATIVSGLFSVIILRLNS